MSKSYKKTKSIKGVIKKILHHDELNNHYILAIITKNGEETALGNIHNPKINSENYKFKGKYVKNKKYGYQFHFDSYEVVLTGKHRDLKRKLKTIKGIDDFRANEIVKFLGKNVKKKLTENPELLKNCNYINKKQIKEIKNLFSEHTRKKEFINKLTNYGVTEYSADKIWTHYLKEKIPANKILDKVIDNPYSLIDDIKYWGYKKSDELALALNYDETSLFRINSSIKYILKEEENNGHSYLPFKTLLEKLNKLLQINIDESLYEEALNSLTKAGDITIEDNKVYLKFLYQAEKEFSFQIKKLVNQKKEKIQKLDKLIEKEEKYNKIKFAENQKKAIKMAIKNPISIITGGPGTGKSLIIKSIYRLYEKTHKGDEVHLASPTGKAANRLEELTGHKAKTIHRLLRYKGQNFVEHYKIPYPGILIIDEFSMTDIILNYHLFNAVDGNLKVVLVGDVNQLPSIGPGNVLNDLIASDIIPTTVLTENFRQASNSMIIDIAEKITEGKMPELYNNEDLTYVEFTDEFEALNKIKEVFSNLHPNFDIFDIQVISPVKNGLLGVKNLNKAIQDVVNPSSFNNKIGDFAVKDKIMVVINDYEKKVFNGEFGEVTKINRNSSLEVEIKHTGEVVEFKKKELNHIQLAYACTVHKSQGSEFKFLIMVLSPKHNIMLKRKLFYTGITRTQQKLMILSNEQTIKKAIANDQTEHRYSTLENYLTLKNVVTVGNRVKIKNLTIDDIFEYEIVPEAEKDILNNKIGVNSTTARNVLNREIGYEFTMKIRNDYNSFKIIDVV